MTKIGALLAALVLIGAIVTACSSTQAPSSNYGSSSSPVAMTGGPAQSSAPAAAGSTITISDMAFGEPLTVSPGATVTIVNKDTVEHSVTSKPDAGFSTDVDGGEQKTFTAPTQPGEYPFICRYHPNMLGTLTVK
jgi:plastocyanin